MSATSITSANSVVTMSVPGLFAAPVTLSGYATERAWNSDAQDLAEVMMGVDGQQSAGYLPAPVKQTFSLQADSGSNSFFQDIARAMKVSKDIYYISCTIVLPSTGESYTGVRGVLLNHKAIADAGKVLQALDYVISWQSLDATVI
jgi:hypothetical protein